MKYAILIMTAILWALSAGTGLAHKVVLFAWVEGDYIHAEAGFGSKRPAKDCEIKAFDAGGSLVFQGKTDQEGKFSAPVPRGHAGDMILELAAGPGHKGAWTIRGDEFGSPASGGTSQPDPSDEQGKTRQEVMDDGPDPVKILAGIGVIFGLALGARFLKKRSKGGARG